MFLCLSISFGLSDGGTEFVPAGAVALSVEDGVGFVGFLGLDSRALRYRDSMSSSVIVSGVHHTTLVDMGFLPIGAVADSGICCAYMALPRSGYFRTVVISFP